MEENSIKGCNSDQIQERISHQHNNSYKTIVNEAFGEDVASFNSSTKSTNNVIGAINHKDCYGTFINSFSARLIRLATACPPGHPARATIIQAVNQISDDKNWDGAYAELAAFDMFFSNELTGPNEIDCDITIPASRTLADSLGNTNANLDGKFRRFNVYFDIKVISDKSQQILDGIIDEVRSAMGINEVGVFPYFNRDISFDKFQENRSKLKSELLRLIDPRKRSDHIRSQVIDSLCYKVAWKPGAYSNANCYDPIQHGINHHKLIFLHAKKFLKDTPTVLVFVNFPWYGEQITMGFKDSKNAYYRSLSESFFYDYKNKSVAASTINKKMTSNISAFDVTKKLSGIIFLDDNCILGEQPDDINVELSYFLNTLADNSLVTSKFSQHMAKIGTDLSINQT